MFFGQLLMSAWLYFISRLVQLCARYVIVICQFALITEGWHHTVRCIVFLSSRRWSDSSFTLPAFNKQWLCSHEVKHILRLLSEAAAVCTNSSPVKVKHSNSQQQKLISLYSLYLLCCFSTIWLSQINLSAPWAKVAEFGHATIVAKWIWNWYRSPGLPKW